GLRQCLGNVGANTLAPYIYRLEIVPLSAVNEKQGDVRGFNNARFRSANIVEKLPLCEESIAWLEPLEFVLFDGEEGPDRVAEENDIVLLDSARTLRLDEQ